MDKIRVVIIDDEIGFIKLLTLNLHLESDILVTGSETSSVKGIEIVKKLQPDIVLLDVNISGYQDGIEAAGEISQISNAKIIMVSSSSEKEVIQRAYAAGATHFLSKADLKQLPDLIRNPGMLIKFDR